MEKRELLAVLLDGDILRVSGTDGADTATIDPFIQDRQEWVTATLNGQSSQYAVWSVRKIVFTGRDGDDHFVNNSNLPSHIWGNAGVDTLVGGGGADRIYGGSWSDILSGGAGNDRIFGGGGNDIAHGGPGDDAIFGHSGAETLHGDDGNDLIRGSSGNDTIFGGRGNDYLNGLTGLDEIHGGSGDDTIFGHAADDLIHAGEGADRVYGGGQNDTIFGEGGDDYLFGTIGANWISGGDGNDKIYGGYGDDHLLGNDGNDRIRAYGGDDTIFGHAGADVLFGSEGNDTIHGGDDADHLHGDAGADNLYGGAGSDQLFGGDGNDGLFGGGFHADQLTGGAGSDRFLTQTGDLVEDEDAFDARLVFVDGPSPNTDAPRDWTDADIEKVDKALLKLHQEAAGALILKDTYSDAPIKIYIADSFTLGSNVGGLNCFNGNQRQIHVRGDLSDESFAATIVHEFAHNWDSNLEGNQGWNAFESLHDQSHADDDFTRSYGRTSAKEDFATNWELIFGYYRWAAPSSPSQLLQLKQAAVRDFFGNFVTGAVA